MTTPTTNLTCPDWCDGRGNKGFDTEISTGQVDLRAVRSDAAP
jgi:hypothetical protein